MIRNLIILLLLISFSFTSNAAWFSRSSGFITSEDFKNSKIKGFNIGVIEKHEKEYYDELSATGLNTVRVVIPFVRCADANKCIYNITDISDKALKDLIENSKQYNFKIIVVGQFQQNPQGDYWQSKLLQAGISKAWKRFAEQYKDEKQIAAYDIFYNPNPQGLINPNKIIEYWTKGAYTIVSNIRDVDENHTIIYQIPNSDPLSMDKIQEIPDNNIVYGVDMFYPWQITLQGSLPQYKERLLYPLGLEFRLDPFGMGQPRAINKDDLTLYLSKVKSWSDKNNKPIIISNWGIVHYAPNNSAYRYVNDILDIYKSNGFSWMYYGFRISQPLDPFIADENPQTITRTPLAPIITLLRENMKGKSDNNTGEAE